MVCLLVLRSFLVRRNFSVGGSGGGRLCGRLREVSDQSRDTADEPADEHAEESAGEKAGDHVGGRAVNIVFPVIFHIQPAEERTDENAGQNRNQHDHHHWEPPCSVIAGLGCGRLDEGSDKSSNAGDKTDERTSENSEGKVNIVPIAFYILPAGKHTDDCTNDDCCPKDYRKHCTPPGLFVERTFPLSKIPGVLKFF